MKRIKTLTLAASMLTLTLGAFPHHALASVRRKPYSVTESSASTAYIVSILLPALLP